MITPERKTSTIDEFQVPDLIQIQPWGYFYIQFKDYPRIAMQSSGLFSTETLRKYLFQYSIDADTSSVFITSSSFGQQELSLLTDELICEEIAGEFYTIQDRIQTHHVAQISLDNLQVERSVIKLLDSYRHEEFNTDIAYEFTNQLDTFIQANGESAIRIINDLLKKQAFDENIISETLKALGRIEDEYTKDQRYQVLMGFIQDSSALIRDGAVSGLSFLDDKRALLQLRMLFEKETITILKSNIEVAIKSLET